MRKTFVTKLIEYAQDHPDVVLITGDLGYSVLEPFQQAFPQRFINAGIAEQNMTGLAAGLALCGKKVVTYSIANFPTLRCLEQIRNDVCYHNASVKVVSVGSGFAYGTQGYTHHGTEDIAILRTLPRMIVYSPACPLEVEWCLKHMMNQDGPGYLRLAKQGEPVIHANLDQHPFPKMIPLITGFANTILSTGVITQYVYEWLKKSKIPLNLYSVPVIKPLDRETLEQICQSSSHLFTVEEHQLDGGFGSAILETIHDLKVNNMIEHVPNVYRLGVQGEIVCDMTTDQFGNIVVQDIEKKYVKLIKCESTQIKTIAS